MSYSEGEGGTSDLHETNVPNAVAHRHVRGIRQLHSTGRSSWSNSNNGSNSNNSWSRHGRRCRHGRQCHHRSRTSSIIRRRRRTKVEILRGKVHRRTGRASGELVGGRGVEKADSRRDAIGGRRRGHRAVHLRAKAPAQITVLAGTGTAARGVGGIHGTRAGGESLQSLFGGVIKAKSACVQAARRGGSGQNLVIGFLTQGHVDQTVDCVPVGILQRHVAPIEQRTKVNAVLVLLLLLLRFCRS
jgi:hypothetical protein